MKIIGLFILVVLATIVLGDIKTYDGHKLYKIVPKDDQEVKLLEAVQRTRLGEFWNEHFVANNDVRVMVPEETQEEFHAYLKKHNIESRELISDVQKAINDQLKRTPIRSSESFHGMTWTQYHNLEEINNWLDELALNYPNIVRTVDMGASVENRLIRGIVIDYNPGRENKLIGVLEGTLHAREWISPATVTWIVKEFLTSSDPEVRSMAESFEWHVFPVVNPDGYVYTFTTHRMWRKNRSLRSFKSCAAVGSDDDMSRGVDLNRNFDFEWMTVGASNDSCTNTYAGPTAFSEPETRAIATYVSALDGQGKLIYYISFHSYTQLFVVPYSHVSTESALLSGNYGDMYEIAIRAAEALKRRYGTEYRVGLSADVLYPMSGSSFDWVKFATNIPVTYLIELRDLGEYGFLLPPEQIIPNNLEIMDAMIEMDRTTRSLGYYSSSATNVIFSTILVAIGISLCKLVQ